MTIEEYLKSKNIKPNNTYFKKLIFRILYSVIIALVLLIFNSINDKTALLLKKYVLETNFKFSYFTSIYNKYFNKIEENSIPVNINTELNNETKYEDGYSFDVSIDYPVKLLESGIVVFIGEKEKYGNTIIVQQSNGIDVWYGNLDNIDVKIYDYIEKGTLIASSNEKLYLVFVKDGKYLDYKDIIK